jgi:hypothetical protein
MCDEIVDIPGVDYAWNTNSKIRVATCRTRPLKHRLILVDMDDRVLKTSEREFPRDEVGY